MLQVSLISHRAHKEHREGQNLLSADYADYANFPAIAGASKSKTFFWTQITRITLFFRLCRVEQGQEQNHVSRSDAANAAKTDRVAGCAG
jgi:hypothetical protein